MIKRRSPAKTDPVSDFDMTERLRIFASVLAARPPGRLLDVACGHGTFSLVAQRLGWKVTAVDVRTQRMPMTEGIEWVQSDVRDYAISAGEFDMIAVLGLLYHLELKDQLDLLRRCSVAPTLVDTHVGAASDVEELGYAGILFDEYNGRSKREWAASGTASYKNRYSFWADEASLLRMFHDSGFAHVLALAPAYMEGRTFFLCLPEPAEIMSLGKA